MRAPLGRKLAGVSCRGAHCTNVMNIRNRRPQGASDTGQGDGAEQAPRPAPIPCTKYRRKPYVHDIGVARPECVPGVTS